MQLLGGDPAHAEDALDGQRGDKGIHLVRPHDELTVRLVPVARDLGQELIRRDAGRRGDTHLGQDRPPDFLGHQAGTASAAIDAGDVQVGLVQRQRFDQRRERTIDRQDPA